LLWLYVLTNKLLLRSQAHKRRLARYKEFIHNPPPHTSLSPDAAEVVELIDALIGPPPVMPAGSVPLTRKQKRKKKKLAKQTQSSGEKNSPGPKTGSAKSTSKPNKESNRQKEKPQRRERVRKGKRERAEKIVKSTDAEVS
jgi:hypothetical protein